MEFKAISSMNGLLAFLETKGGNHENYHHYTNLESLIKIIESGYFHLTRGNSSTMNDQHECMMKGSHEVWNRTYIGSFAFGDSENMAMWGLYGLPWEEAVRITIPRKAMRNWVAGLKTVYSVAFQGGNCLREPIAQPCTIKLSDLVYINGRQSVASSKLLWSSSSLSLQNNQPLADIDTKPAMTGFIKNDAWKYENEVRIHLQFQKPINCEKIAIPVPEEVITAMTITAGPYFSGDLQERLAAKIPQIIGEQQTQNSGFQHLVKYRTLCSLCEFQKFQKKKGHA